MGDRWFVRWKNEIVEIGLTMKRMVAHPLMMMLNCLWIVISGQEEQWIANTKKLAEQDLKNGRDVMPNAFLQGAAVTVCTFYYSFNRKEIIFFCRLTNVHHH